MYAFLGMAHLVIIYCVCRFKLRVSWVRSYLGGVQSRGRSKHLPSVRAAEVELQSLICKEQRLKDAKQRGEAAGNDAEVRSLDCQQRLAALDREEAQEKLDACALELGYGKLEHGYKKSVRTESIRCGVIGLACVSMFRAHLAWT